MQFGSDGSMPKAPFADVYVQVWELFHGGQRERALEVFSKLLLVINRESHLRGLPAYMMKRRGVFKTAVSRQEDVQLAPDEIEELEYNFAALKPYLQV
jgi:dihydrodipicolinate synthase/N-acetylneuraminate lyase